MMGFDYEVTNGFLSPPDPTHSSPLYFLFSFLSGPSTVETVRAMIFSSI